MFSCARCDSLLVHLKERSSLTRAVCSDCQIFHTLWSSTTLNHLTFTGVVFGFEDKPCGEMLPQACPIRESNSSHCTCAELCVVFVKISCFMFCNMYGCLRSRAQGSMRPKSVDWSACTFHLSKDRPSDFLLKAVNGVISRIWILLWVKAL